MLTQVVPTVPTSLEFEFGVIPKPFGHPPSVSSLKRRCLFLKASHQSPCGYGSKLDPKKLMVKKIPSLGNISQPPSWKDPMECGNSRQETPWFCWMGVWNVWTGDGITKPIYVSFSICGPVGHWKQVPARCCPSSLAQLVNITPISRLYGGYIYIYNIYIYIYI